MNGHLRRAFLGGYRRNDVDAIVSGLEEAQSAATLRAEQIEAACAELEKTLVDTRNKLGETSARETKLAAYVVELRARRGELEQASRQKAEKLLEAARADAARIRSDAVVEGARARADVENLIRFRDTLAATMRTLTQEFERVTSTEPVDLETVAPTATVEEAKPAPFAPTPLTPRQHEPAEQATA